MQICEVLPYGLVDVARLLAKNTTWLLLSLGPSRLTAVCLSAVRGGTCQLVT